MEFEKFDITEAPTLFVLNQRENYGIDKIIDINKFSIFYKFSRNCMELPPRLNNLVLI